MRLLMLCLTLPILLGSCVPAPLSEADRKAVVAEVTEASGQLLDAMNAHDVDRVLSYYSIDSDFIYVSCTEFFFGPTYRSVAGLYYRPSRDVAFEQEIVQVKVLSRDAAVITAHGSSSRAEHLFWTQVWVRNAEGAWRITHAHQSWPGCDEPPSPHPGATLPESDEAPDDGD